MECSGIDFEPLILLLSKAPLSFYIIIRSSSYRFRTHFMI